MKNIRVKTLRKKGSLYRIITNRIADDHYVSSIYQQRPTHREEIFVKVAEYVSQIYIEPKWLLEDHLDRQFIDYVTDNDLV